MVKARIIGYLQEHGCGTSHDIADELGMDAGNVTDYLNKMRNETGVIRVSGKEIGTGGRPRNIWKLRLG
jgi:predicted ArsR family transcriptional regulator